MHVHVNVVVFFLLYVLIVRPVLVFALFAVPMFKVTVDDVAIRISEDPVPMGLTIFPGAFPDSAVGPLHGAMTSEHLPRVHLLPLPSHFVAIRIHHGARSVHFVVKESAGVRSLIIKVVASALLPLFGVPPAV